MDYQLNVYPSSEKEMLNVKVDHREKQIKAVQEGKLKALYARKFGDAVRKYNDYALSGRLIKDYYASILSSNIPEVYRLSIIVRYDLAVPNEKQLIDTSFSTFKKKLDEQPFMAICCVYSMSVDEFKELNIFFVPISDGYKTQLAVRNDIIDVAKKMEDSKDNWNILKALPIFTDHIEQIWKACCDSNIVSQSELKKKAHAGEFSDPMSLHSIEVGMLKENMNHLQRLTHENQMLEAQVADEKTRIIKELNWSKQMGPTILRAEEDRKAEIRRQEEEARRAEQERIAAEERAAEERRRAEEMRKAEAARLTEQARRNYSLRSMLSNSQQQKSNAINENPFGAFDIVESKPAVPKPVEQPVAPIQNDFQQFGAQQPVQNVQPVVEPPKPVNPMSTPTISNDDFKAKLALHREWMQKYNVNKDSAASGVTKKSLAAPERLVMMKQIIVGFESADSDVLVGAAMRNCVFNNCHFSGEFFACIFEGCTFINSTVDGCSLTRCGIKGMQCKDNVVLENITLSECTIVDSNVSKAKVKRITSAMNSKIANVDFSDAKFEGCDIKRNTFSGCNFDGAWFESCDARAAEFNDCNTANLTISKSLFSGSNLSID